MEFKQGQHKACHYSDVSFPLSEFLDFSPNTPL